MNKRFRSSILIAFLLITSIGFAQTGTIDFETDTVDNAPIPGLVIAAAVALGIAGRKLYKSGK